MMDTACARPRDLDPLGTGAVDDLLVEHVARRGAALREVSPHASEMLEPLHGLLDGGKRLRAAFCLWGARGAAGHEPVPGAVEAAAALEMFHLAALVHDDVMDRSASRRGLATVHRSFAEAHRGRRLRGSAATFGDGVAVLVGDLCLTWADDLLSAAARTAGPLRAVAVREVWEQMRDQVLAGQYLDLLAQARPATSAADVTRVLHYKSAKYTVEHPLRLGAALAGADPVLVSCYGAFGVRVGEAFQLRDDVLGVLGDPVATGKSTYDDVREGKRTLLVTLAEEVADPAQRSALDRHLGDPHLDAAGLDAVRRELVDTGALARVEERIATLVAQADDLLGRMPIDPAARDALAALTDACAWRAS